jgi:hypothetical protein
MLHLIRAFIRVIRVKSFLSAKVRVVVLLADWEGVCANFGSIYL